MAELFSTKVEEKIKKIVSGFVTGPVKVTLTPEAETLLNQIHDVYEKFWYKDRVSEAARDAGRRYVKNVLVTTCLNPEGINLDRDFVLEYVVIKIYHTPMKGDVWIIKTRE